MEKDTLLLKCFIIPPFHLGSCVFPGLVVKIKFTLTFETIFILLMFVPMCGSLCTITSVHVGLCEPGLSAPIQQLNPWNPQSQTDTHKTLNIYVQTCLVTGRHHLDGIFKNYFPCGKMWYVAVCMQFSRIHLVCRLHIETTDSFKFKMYMHVVVQRRRNLQHPQVELFLHTSWAIQFLRPQSQHREEIDIFSLDLHEAIRGWSFWGVNIHTSSPTNTGSKTERRWGDWAFFFFFCLISNFGKVSQGDQ